MDTESLVQPNRRLMFFEKADELEGHLEVLDQLEVSAGYADIYRGFWTDPQGKRVEVAIKELKDLVPKNQHTDQGALISRRDTRMKREVFVWSQTTHPNLHPLLGFRSQPRPRLISPWCRHGNLTHYLENNPDLSRLDKLRLIFQAACGLEHLHAQTPPICHADIKPENILVNEVFQAALSDFGLSRVLDAFGHHNGFTTSESVKGTYNYIAPELFNEEKPRSTLKADVYAFGGLILTVMSGKPPFWGLKQPRILARVTQDQPPNPEDHQSLRLSDPLWSLMRRCWDMTPETRPSMPEVLRELWGAISKEEFDLWSRLGLASVLRIHDDDSSNMDLDTSGATETSGLFSCLNLGAVVAGDSFLNFNINKESCYALSEETLRTAWEILETLEVDSTIIPVIKKYIAAAVDIGSMLVELTRTIGQNESIAKSIGSNALKLIGRLERLREESTPSRVEGLSTLVIDVRRELRGTEGNIKEWCSSGLLPYAIADDGERLRSYKQSMKRVLEEIQLLVSLNTDDLLAELESKELQKERRRLLACLGDGNYGVKGNTIEDVTCLPGTRVDILEQIDNWIRGATSSERGLWIRGTAGRGKSTIASTVAHHWRFRASCAIFHLRRGQDALNSRLVCALARQLGNSLVSEVKNAVLESIRENEDIANGQLSEQFRTLLVASLGKLKEHPYPILLIVDALDECDDAKDAVDFVRLIHRHSSSFPANVKFLLTCRPEAPIVRALQPNGWNELDLDSAPEVSNDLTRFIRHACEQLRNDHKLPENWPSIGEISRLVDMSQGLFQWARTAITYISNGSPVERLGSLLRRQARLVGLDDLYHQILSKAMESTRHDPQKQQLLCSILGAIAVAPYPVSLEVIVTLYGDSETLEGMEHDNIIQFARQDILADLTSLLHIPTSASESVRFTHTSIRDLLVSRERCQERPYYVDAAQHHRQLARLSLDIMLRLLKENICGLSDLSQAVSEIQDVAEREVPKALRYCCQAWSVHLIEGLRWSESKANDVTGQLDNFISFSQKKVLGWIEVMSVIGVTSEGITMAKQVYRWLSRCPSEILESRPLVNLWNDIHRFVTAFLEPISFGPLHIYASAMPHCPWKTELWRLYGSSAKVRILGGHQMSTWPATLWARSTDGDLQYVAFSGDGSLVITGSETGNVQFWETDTGRQEGETLGDCSGSASYWCVGVSPDGRVLASGSKDGAIRLRDIQTGRQLGEPLTCHGDAVLDVCFSPDGRALASVSSDKTIRLWDTQTGRQFGEPLTGHSDTIGCICFSPDGRVLASGSKDRTIRLWDTQTGRHLGQPLTGNRWAVWSVCFSPDSRVLASGSGDGTIRLWDTQTGRELRKPLTGQDDIVGCVCFSPDGGVLASGCSDGTIRLWDTQTGRQLREPLTGHNYFVQYVCFSPDGGLLASGFRDSTIRLWDIQKGSQLGEPLTGHISDADYVCISPDGRALASGSEDGMQLWDTQTGSQLGEPLTGHISDADYVCISPDGRALASGSEDGMQLWDTQTGRQLGEPLTDDSYAVRCVSFSPDGRVLAFGSWYGVILLWDIQTGSSLGEPLTCRGDSVDCVCFSPDGRTLASGSDGSTVRLWDTQTGSQLGEPLTGHSSGVVCVCFSPDGRVLASGSADTDKTIRLWDTQTGRELGKIDQSTRARSISFSPDGLFLVGHLDNGDCHIWDVLTLQKCHPPPRIPSRIAIGFKDHWVTHFSQRLLWLPAEYWRTRKDRIILYDKTLAVAHKGSVSSFDLSPLPWSLGGIL